MRYFQTTNASRRYVTGGLAYTFEPVENIGGSWFGVLAVETDSAADALEKAKIAQVSEITVEEYDGFKKKSGRAERQFSTIAANAAVESAAPNCGGCGSGRVYKV